MTAEGQTVTSPVDAGAESLPAAARTRRVVVSGQTAAFATASIVAFATFLAMGSGTTFRGDDWDFVANRSLTDPVGLMRPFNMQWVAVPAVIFRVIYAVVGMHSYLPYLIVLLGIHALAANELRLLVSSIAGRWTGFAVGLLMLFVGSASENFHTAFQIGMVVSTFLGLAAIRGLFAGWRAPWLAALLTLSIASHAVGAAFIVVALALAAARERPAVMWLCVPVVIFGAWFLLFDLPSMAGSRVGPMEGIAAAPGFVAVGFAATAGSILGVDFRVGVLALGLAASVLVLRRPPPAVRTVLVAGLIGLVVEFALIAAARADYGISAANWTRYRYAAVPLMLVAFAPYVRAIRPRRPRWKPAWRVAGFALTAAVCALNLSAYVEDLPVAMYFSHQARAEVAIVMWTSEARRPSMDVHLPAVDRLRVLISEGGTSLQDALIPGVVPAVPKDIAARTCRDMLADVSLVEHCVSHVESAVGSNLER